jgi:hypothetical protein
VDPIYKSQGHGWLSVHGGLTTMGQRSRSGAREVIVVAQRKREEVIGVLNRGSRWCSDREMVLGVRMRDCSRGGCSSNGGALVARLIGS